MASYKQSVKLRIEEYLSKISYCISTNAINNEILKDLLISAFYFIKLGYFQVHFGNNNFIEYNKQLMSVCGLCKKLEYNIVTDCGHNFCKWCLMRDFLKKTSGNLLGKIVCNHCRCDISSNLLYKVFGSTKKVTEIRSNAKKKLMIEEIPKFNCEICLKSYNIEDGLTLDCEHRYCKPCLESHIEYLINSNKVSESEFCCPSCKIEISPFIVQGNFAELNLKFLNLRSNNYKPSSELYVFKKCPFCDSCMEIPTKLKKLTCAGCKRTYCPQCNENHPTPGCLNTKTHFTANTKNCPKCGEAIEKESGCNFVKCPWPRCKDTCFCYICLKVLQKPQHYSHYFQHGPYGETCNTIDGIPE